MALLSAAVQVTSCTSQNNDEITLYDESDAFRAFDSLFRKVVGSPRRTSEGERATKRRKLPGGEHANVYAQETFDADKSAVLVKVRLDLIPKDAQTGFSPPSDDSRGSVVLKLASFSQEDANCISFSLIDPASATRVNVAATASPDVLNPLVAHLEAAASVGTEWNKSSSKSRNDFIPFCRCVLSAPSQNSIPLDLELRWPLNTSLFDTWRARFQHRANLKILSTYFPNALAEDKTPWTLSDFYDAVHVPKNDRVSKRIADSLPSTDLYPYQQRSVDWMLRREGKVLSPSGETQTLNKRAGDQLPVSFSETQDALEKKCYVSRVRGMIITDINQDWDHVALHGGILAEEMGLGKSVELISLMCLNKREITEEDVLDPYLGNMAKASGATLIITPPAILEQWRHEINNHAPQLKVLHYKGLSRRATSKTEHDETTVEHLMKFDVVLTSYDVLSKELHHVTPPPERSLRNKKVHKRRKSPLVEISWWRVCLDEAQMVESGVSQAATVARMIPRCNAWAVSGTPLRNSVTDLVGLLIFLRCEPFASTKDLFARLDKASFRDLISRMALRHTKDQIRGDLDIPPQKRVVITVPFTEIEEEYYKDMFRQMCDACFLAPDGTPLLEDRGIDHPETIDRMREWLVRLRQLCLHSHVGEKNKKALGRGNRTIRTVQEVLQVMIDQNEASLKSEVREMILAQMRRGHIISTSKTIVDANEQAIAYYKQALETSQESVRLARDEIAAELTNLRQTDPTKAEEHEESDGEEDQDESSGKFARITTLRRSLRWFLELEHACQFFIGNMYFQWKENTFLTVPDSAQYHEREKLENEWYDKAKSIRQELLKETQTRTQRQMKKIKGLQDRHQDLDIPEIEDLGGIESFGVIEKLATIARVINLQSAKLKEWRNKIIDILTMTLVDQDDGKELTGEEYETSTKVQDELYVYIQAFRTIVADMATAVNGTEDNLLNHEMEQAVRQASDLDPLRQGHAPRLLLKLARERQGLRPSTEHGSLRGVLSSARQVITSLQYRADMADKRAAAELAIAQKYLAQIQDIFSTQTELTTNLEKEHEQFRLTMNLRLEFYRQLQHISGTVEDYKDDVDEVFDIREFAQQTKLVEERKVKVQRFKVKQTYLQNLRQGAAEPEGERKCPICFETEYELGILTTCGHKFCRDCMFAWWKINHNCPECRTQLTRADMKEITHNSRNSATAQEEDHDTPASQASSSPLSRMSIYSGMRDATMNEIKTVKLDDSYGSKIDMMARHLLWIRNNDSGAKTIIYSQFTDFLQVLRLALKRFKIGVSGIRDKNGIEKFKNDPSVECFLLDAKSNSSGLNLVNATYVFLCEPLINPALELQAIARVHRIGQQRATTVFMYIVGNTVEEAIYDISVKRRLEHMGRDTGSRSGTATPAMTEQAQERSLEVANSEEIKAASLGKLVREGNYGEVVVADDLWKCLFGKPRNIPTPDEQLPEGRRRHATRARREPFLQQVEAQPVPLSRLRQIAREGGLNALRAAVEGGEISTAQWQAHQIELAIEMAPVQWRGTEHEARLQRIIRDEQRGVDLSATLEQILAGSTAWFTGGEGGEE